MALDLNDKTSNGNTLTNNNSVADITSTTPFAALTHVGGFTAGSSMTLSAADSASLSMTGDFTLQCWVYFPTSAPSTPPAKYLMAKYNTTGDQRSYLMSISDNSPTYTFKANVSPDGAAVSQGTSGTFDLSADTWYHFAFAYTAASHSGAFIKDGSLLTTDTSFTPTSVYNSTAIFEIGGVTAFAEYVTAYIGDIRVYNVARNATAVNGDKSQLLTGSESGLVAYWPLMALPPTTNIKTVAGVTYANMGKVSGVAKASIGKISGLA